MTSEVASTTGASQSASAGTRGGGRLGARLRDWWWLVAIVTALVSLVVGGSVQRAVDHRQAARDLYRVQVLTTASRFIDEERRQIALPVAKRNVGAFLSLADSIGADLGVNGESTLDVSLGTGSVAPFTQIAFAPTVTSPYGSTTFAVWFVRGAGSAGITDQNVGVCLLSSTLVGPGRATAVLHLGDSEMMAPCSAGLFSPSPDAMLPDLSRAGIRRSAG
jgi:hypothetical protein